MDTNRLIAETPVSELLKESFSVVVSEPREKPIDWAHLSRVFPTHREHIFRIRKNQGSLRLLRTRLYKNGVKHA